MGQNYGTMSENGGGHTTIPMQVSSTADEDDLVGLLGFEKSPGNEFWEKVAKVFDDGKKGIIWHAAINRVRVDLIKEACDKKDPPVDPILYLMETAYQYFLERHPNDEELLPSFRREISKLVEILLDRADIMAEEEDDDSPYSVLIDPFDNPVRRSLLHIAAQSNLVDIANELVKRYDGLLYQRTQADSPEQSGFLPLEFALKGNFDEMASILINAMSNGSVRVLFTWQNNVHDEWRQYKFKDYIVNPSMKKTVIAVLDSFIDPSWPYLPTADDESMLPSAWKKIPDIPLRYHFNYQVLDGDYDGKDPSCPTFNKRDLSPLHLLIMSSHSKECIRHPVVRMLVRQKWDSFAKYYVWGSLPLHLLFLAVLSVAMLLGASDFKHDLLSYTSTADFVRLSCEILLLIMALIYIFTEIDQFIKEGWFYWQDVYNYLDLVGLIGILVLIPFRLKELKAEWSIGSIVFMINFLRVFKFFSAWEAGGLYTNTLKNIILKDLPKFGAVYFVLVMTFTGGLYLALTAANSVALAGDYDGILLKEIRALADANSFTESFAKYNLFLTIVILVNMFAIMVVLSNILIAQLSNRYGDAQQEAGIQYDIDKALLVLRVENRRLLNLRVKNYREGALVNDTSTVKEILSDWEAITAGPDLEKQKQLLGKILKKNN